MNTFFVHIASSKETIYQSNHVVSASLPGVDGRFMILYEHAPLISMLTKGVILIKTDDNDSKSISINVGVIRMIKNKLSILID